MSSYAEYLEEPHVVLGKYTEDMPTSVVRVKPIKTIDCNCLIDPKDCRRGGCRCGRYKHSIGACPRKVITITGPTNAHTNLTMQVVQFAPGLLGEYGRPFPDSTDNLAVFTDVTVRTDDGTRATWTCMWRVKINDKGKRVPRKFYENTTSWLVTLPDNSSNVSCEWAGGNQHDKMHLQCSALSVRMSLYGGPFRTLATEQLEAWAPPMLEVAAPSSAAIVAPEKEESAAPQKQQKEKTPQESILGEEVYVLLGLISLIAAFAWYSYTQTFKSQ